MFGGVDGRIENAQLRTVVEVMRRAFVFSRRDWNRVFIGGFIYKKKKNSPKVQIDQIEAITHAAHGFLRNLATMDDGGAVL